MYKPSIVVYGAEGLHRYSTYIVQFSALDEITDNHAGNSPLIAPDGEGKAAVDEPFLVGAGVAVLRCMSDWRGGLVKDEAYLRCRVVQVRLIPEYAGSKHGLLTRVERDMAIFLPNPSATILRTIALR